MNNWNKIKLIILIGALIVPVNIQAAMKSDSYIIYENVMHSFDGPTISNVSCTPGSTSITVIWDTNVAADGFIIYDTDNSFASSKEQGHSVKNSTGQSVIVSGLDGSTIYYYKIRSERVNGGVTIDNTVYSCTTSADTGCPECPDCPECSGGGGILIIDKTDKIAPIITNVLVADITANSAAIGWETDEEATGFVEYGQNQNYGSTYGQWASSTEHSVVIDNLLADTKYYFRVLSSDGWGNVSYSDNQTFTTAKDVGEEIEEEIEPEKKPDEPDEPDEESILAEATRRVMKFISRILPEVSLNKLGRDPLTTIDDLDDLIGFMPAPILSGEPRVEISATEATVFWTTDIAANSLVAIAPEDKYNPGADEPYLQVVGDAENMTTNHEVTIYGLTSDTVYNYQLRSKADLGPIAKSKNFTFQTSIETLQITSFFTQIIDDETAIFKWVTNKEANSEVKFAPYHNNILAVDQSKTIKDNAVSVIHEIKVSEFVGGTFYDVELINIDSHGNVATEVLSHFATTEDDLPPTISHIKADSTVFLDRSNKIQTIISWLTNEPSTSRVYYQEGVHGGNVELTEKTNLNTNYTKEHVMVIAKFKPGIVYSFNVESVDSGGNITKSKAHTFMTAKKKDSIIQVIMKILEDTFGWMKKIM